MDLKDFDLAGGRVEVLCVLSRVSQGEGVDLDPEGDALLPAVLPGSELCADAVHLKADDRALGSERALYCFMCTSSTKRACVGYLHENRSSFLHVPQELRCVELGGMSLWLHNAH